MADTVFNIGRTALLVAAIASGDVEALADATADRVHQDIRLAEAPGSVRAISAATEAGAWCAWLSGSGPTVASLCDPASARRVAEAMPDGGRAMVLEVDTDGVCLVGG
jgi:homoserine kinase